jgi:hypothetical protein
MGTDFISLGALLLPKADILFESFNETMNQLLRDGIVLKHPNLDFLRHSSSLLSAAILTVASIHIPGRSGHSTPATRNSFRWRRDL